MDQDKLIRSLRLQLRLERTLILLVALALLGYYAFDYIQDRPYAIVVGGQPVAYLATSEAAKQVVGDVKKSIPGVQPSQVVFTQKVVVKRASGDAKLMTHDEALKAAVKAIPIQVTRFAILVDGTPAVAVDTKEDAGAVLEAAKERFGSMAKNLMEEPQFKEQVKVQQMDVDPSLYRRDVKEALHVLLSGTGGPGTYIVAEGDAAFVIAQRLEMSLEELQSLNPGRNLHRLQIGDQLRVTARSGSSKPRLTVVVRDQKSKTESVPYRTEQISSVNLLAGKKVQLSPGKNGVRKVVLAETYENGVRAGWEVVEETVIEQPVPRRIAVGIKPR